MNTKLLLIFFIIFGIKGNAQDIITKKNGDDIKSKVVEVGLDEVKYKKFENINGPTYSLLKSDILMIRYENGTKDIFNTPLNPPNIQNIIVNSINITGRWKSSSGVIFFIEKQDTFNFKYYNVTDPSKIYYINAVLDEKGNPKVNLYKSNVGYEMTVINDMTIRLVNLSNSEDTKTWIRVVEPLTNHTNVGNASTENVSTNEDIEPFSSKYFKKFGSSGWYFGYKNETFSFFNMHEKSIFNSNFGIGYKVGGSFYSSSDDFAESAVDSWLIGTRVSYHIPNNYRFDPYVGLSSGLYFISTEIVYSDPNLDDYSDFDSVGGWDWHLGLIWHAGDNLGLTAEYSGRGEMIFAGLSWRFDL